MADEEESPHTQQLRAALHYAVGRICDEVGDERRLPFDRAVVATLTELTLSQAAVMARDLELFAQHARRTVVGAEDVKLLVRRSPGLADEVQREARRLSAEADLVKQHRKAKRGRKCVARGAAQSAAADSRSAVAAAPPEHDDAEVLELE